MEDSIALEFKREKASFSTTLQQTWKRNPTLIIGGVLVVFILFFAIFGDQLAPFNPIENNYSTRLVPPNGEHWFGTDKFGRDIFSRVLVGTRIDLQIGLICTIIPFIFGTIVGLISGYSGGVVDNLLMRIVDISVSFPYLVLVIIIVLVVMGRL